jgi:hypothetical protein
MGEVLICLLFVLEKTSITSDTYKNVNILLHGNKFLWIFVHHHQEINVQFESFDNFRYLQKVAIRDWNKNRELEQFEAMGGGGKIGDVTHLITTENVEDSYALLEVFRTDRSLHRCVTDGMINL